MGGVIDPIVDAHVDGFDMLTQPFSGARREREAFEAANDISRGNAKYIGDLKVPELKFQDYNPEAFNPEMMQAQTVSEDPMVRSMQMSALQKMAGLAETGLSAEDQLGFHNARSQGNQMSRAGSQAAIQDAQNRGVAGSGMEFAMREMANQGGAERAQQAALQQAADSARQRALYNQAYMTNLGNQRQQDFGVNRANTDIINQFNQANTQNKNAAAQYNVANRNQAQQQNQQGRIGVQQQNFDNEFSKRKAAAGMNDQVRQNYLAQSAAAGQDKKALWEIGGNAAAAYAGG